MLFISNRCWQTGFHSVYLNLPSILATSSLTFDIINHFNFNLSGGGIEQSIIILAHFLLLTNGT